MSNIIRPKQLKQIEKKIIGTKKINQKTSSVIHSYSEQAAEVVPEHKKQDLLQEIEVLEARYRQLKSQIAQDQENAQVEIDEWWKQKQEEAELEVQRLTEEALAKGLQEGFEQGVQQAEQEFQQKRQEMHELIQTAYEEKAKITQQSESFLLALSIKIAKKVVKEELHLHPDQLLNMVKQALQQVEEYEDIVIQVSPEDYPIILPFIEELETYIGDASALKVMPVPNFAKGDCMIHTTSGSYDVTIDSQLKEIKKHLLAYYQEKINDEPKKR